MKDIDGERMLNWRPWLLVMLMTVIG
jgi:hypothetical protein